ncbi:MAG: biotin/lipoyl-containing protein, partial [Ignavibacteria bacterium]
MLVDIVMPKMGESIMDGKILKWYKKPGDSIGKDETLLEISTDKVDTEVPSAEGGVVVELLFNENDTANVGDVIARIETDPSKAKIQTNKPTAVTKSGTNKEEAAVKKVQNEIQEAFKVKTESKIAPAESDIDTKEGTGFFSPLVINIAAKEGISMNELSAIK